MADIKWRSARHLQIIGICSQSRPQSLKPEGSPGNSVKDEFRSKGQSPGDVTGGICAVQVDA